MVIPETPRASEPTDRTDNPRLRLLGIVGAAILILAAIPVLGNLTSVDPESAEPTVTTTSTLVATSSTFGVVEVGVPIDLKPLIALDTPAFAIVELDDRILIFSRGPGGFGATLTIYDGESETAPPILVIEGSYVDDIIPTGDGLLAYGHQLHPHRATAWRSPDGLTWSPEVLPMGQAEGIPVMLHDANSTEDMVLITGLASSSYGDLALDAEARSLLVDRFAGFVDWFYWQTTPDGDVAFEVEGPLGLNVGVARASELGLDPTPYRQLNEGPGPSDTDVRSLTWVSVSGGPWNVMMTESPIGPNWMFTGRDGWVWSTNMHQSGFLATADGSHWIRVPSNHAMEEVRRWGRRFSGRSSEGVLMSSPEAINWRQLDLSGLLGRPEEWYLDPYDSAGAGLAVVAVRYADITWPAVDDVWLKSDGELELLLSGPYRDLVVWRSGTELVRIPRGSLPSASVAFDFGAGTMDLIGPSGGEVLMTLTVEELTRFHRFVWLSPVEHQYLLFSSDGLTWTLQDLNSLSHVTGVDVIGHTLFVRVLQEGTELILRGDLP